MPCRKKVYITDIMENGYIGLKESEKENPESVRRSVVAARNPETRVIKSYLLDAPVQWAASMTRAAFSYKTPRA